MNVGVNGYGFLFSAAYLSKNVLPFMDSVKSCGHGYGLLGDPYTLQPLIHTVPCNPLYHTILIHHVIIINTLECGHGYNAFIRNLSR
jgi:hypothetical protein